MITDCFGARQWDLSGTETIFVQGVFALVKILVPIALSVHTWKVCRTEPTHQRTSMLGLEKAPCQPRVETRVREGFEAETTFAAKLTSNREF